MGCDGTGQGEARGTELGAWDGMEWDTGDDRGRGVSHRAGNRVLRKRTVDPTGFARRDGTGRDETKTTHLLSQLLYTPLIILLSLGQLYVCVYIYMYV